MLVSVSSFTQTSVFCATPFVLRKALDKSTILSPRQYMTRRGLEETSATTVASRFSLSAKPLNDSQSLASITKAIRSWDSDIASSVPSRPSYFLGTLSRLITKPSVSSPQATETPPAPKSLQRFINLATSGLRKRRWIFLSVGGLPFWTSAPQESNDSIVCSFDEPVAPPQPSLPVRPPNKIIKSPSPGVSLRTFSRGTAPITAPSSIRFATKLS